MSEAVKDQAEAASGGKGEVETVELSKRRRSLARRVAESKATIPHLYLTATAPSAGLADVIAASARALREHPRLNGSYRDGDLELYSRINIAFSLAAGGEQLQPTVFDADAKSAAEIEVAIVALSERARDGSITAPETSGATFTVTAISQSEIDGFTGVVNPAHVATLSAVLGDRVALTLACDHRALIAEEAAPFLGRICELLAEPARRG